MDDTRERLIVLEQAVAHANEWNAYRHEQHERRLSALESKPDVITRVMGAGGWIKLILAVLIPLLVLLATGDIGAALRAARSPGG
jgi:hypothetical protein